MFDRIDRSDNRVIFPEAIEIKRAPTDESVRLLSEFESSMRDKVVASYIPGDNRIHAAAVHFVARPDEHTHEVVVAFTLNGEEHLYRERLDGRAIRMGQAGGDTRALAEMVLRRVADAIAIKLLADHAGSFQRFGR